MPGSDAGTMISSVTMRGDWANVGVANTAAAAIRRAVRIAISSLALSLHSSLRRRAREPFARVAGEHEDERNKLHHELHAVHESLDWTLDDFAVALEISHKA